MTTQQIWDLMDDPKEYLESCKYLRKDIARLRSRIANLRELVESTTVTLKEDGGISGSGYKQSLVANTVCRIAELQGELIAACMELSSLEMEIREVIDMLVRDERHNELLVLRYIAGYSWRIVAEYLGCHIDYAHRLHGAALHELRENFAKCVYGAPCRLHT